jgi:hypothetical protein
MQVQSQVPDLVAQWLTANDY